MMTILVHCQNEQGEDAKTASRLLHLLRAGQNKLTEMRLVGCGLLLNVEVLMICNLGSLSELS